jgi:hypothetical protein
MQPLPRTAPTQRPKLRRDATSWLLLLGLLPAVGCSNSTGPGKPDILQGRWVGTSGAGIAYEYVFTATGKRSTNARTGNDAPTYSLAYTLTPGASDSVTSWYETPIAYWGGSSLGTINDDTTMTVEAQTVAPFIMHKRP